MNTVPIAFAFDNKMVMPACVCISSLLTNAEKGTFYDIFILHPAGQQLQKEGFEILCRNYLNCAISYIEVDDNVFSGSYEIRGINTLTYYRLLIPELIPQYDKILYSDVDVIFRADLSEIYSSTELERFYLAGVNSLSFLQKDRSAYYKDKIGIDPEKVIYAGNLIINSKKIREDGLVGKMVEMTKNRYVFQDLDILNIVCKEKIMYLPPFFCVTTDISEYASLKRYAIKTLWTEEEINYALRNGIIHYNGQKPWKGVCINFDIWWEYYRNSLFFNESEYFRFFKNRLEELDGLSLWKRIKILIRYFVYGRSKY